MKLGLVGYGFGGRIFHAPFIQAADGVEIGGVVARSADKIAQIAVDLPGVPVFASLSDLIADGSFDVVTITTPPATHTPLTLEAIEAGLHVVCDKPFSMNLRDAAQMAGAAKQKGVLLNVFQNRRRDTDLVTLASLIDAGELGDIQRVHNRMDFDQIETLERGPDGGLLRDLGSHLVDQMLWLLGPVEFVDAQINHLEFSEGHTDADFVIHLRHVSGAHSYVSASKANHLDARELRVYGTKGAYVVNGTDVQARGPLMANDPLPPTIGARSPNRLGERFMVKAARAEFRPFDPTTAITILNLPKQFGKAQMGRSLRANLYEPSKCSTRRASPLHQGRLFNLIQHYNKPTHR